MKTTLIYTSRTFSFDTEVDGQRVHGEMTETRWTEKQNDKQTLRFQIRIKNIKDEVKRGQYAYKVYHQAIEGRYPDNREKFTFTLSS